METQVHFSHMNRSEAIEDYALEKFESVIEEHLQNRNRHLQVWLILEAGYNNKGPRRFKCEACLRFSPRREVFVSKTSEDVYDAIMKTNTALNVLLRDEMKKRKARRNEPQPEALPTA